MGLSNPSQISVLDLCPVTTGASASQTLQNTLDLARTAESLGYHRYWLAEHHGMTGIASSSPEVIIGHVAQVTQRIRVGAGGIMLPNHASLKVAEVFKTLEAFHPGRIDLGLGRAPGSASRAALALRGREGRMGAEDFPDQVADLFGFLFEEFPESHPFRSVKAIPSGVGLPEIWILGSSDWGARFAAENGLPFAFAQHFSTLPAKQVIALYKDRFRPSRIASEPKTIVASHVICAATDEEARELALATEYSFYRFRSTGISEPLLSVSELKALQLSQAEWEHIRASSMPKFVGSPQTILSQFEDELGNVGMNEWMVTTLVYDHAARKNSYDLLMGAI